MKQYRLPFGAKAPSAVTKRTRPIPPSSGGILGHHRPSESVTASERQTRQFLRAFDLNRLKFIRTDS
jgi:hypothetical protein